MYSHQPGISRHHEYPHPGASSIPSQSHGSNVIGHPIEFVTGQFAGFTMRAHLEELQKADLGRKFVL
jgi:hypothetical protein